MNSQGSGFVTIINYGSYQEGTEELLSLVTELSQNILTESSDNILIQS